MTGGPNPGSDSAFDVTFTWAGRLLARVVGDWKRVLGFSVVGGAIGVAIALVLPNQYTSTATFIAQGSTSLTLPAALQGAAASLGLDKGSDYSPKFYADLLTSRPVLLSAVQYQYHVTDRGDSTPATYLTLAKLDKVQPALALEGAIRDLARRITASADVRTNMITLSVRTRYPSLSRDVASRLLAALDSLNVGFRRNQSRESREFYETRVLQSRLELDTAESAVLHFLQDNRVISSPALQFEHQRLQREAELKQGLYAIVVQQYEQARLQEARTVPTLTVLAEPFTPVKKSYPPRRLIVVLCAALALMVLWMQVTIRGAVARFQGEAPEDWEALRKHVPLVGRFGRVK